MANHGFVTSKRWFKADQIEQDLQEINTRRFNGRLTIQRNEWDGFDIGPGYPFAWTLWITNVHKLEFRHQMGDWCWWTQTVFENELALKYNGTISDEGVSEKWSGESEKYMTFQSYLDAQSAHLPSGFQQTVIKVLTFFAKIGRSVPDEVRDTMEMT